MNTSQSLDAKWVLIFCLRCYRLPSDYKEGKVPDGYDDYTYDKTIIPEIFTPNPTDGDMICDCGEKMIPKWKENLKSENLFKTYLKHL